MYNKLKGGFEIMITKEKLFEINNEINNAVSLLFNLRNPELYGAYGPSFKSIQSSVQKAVRNYNEIRYSQTPNSNYEKAIEEMGLNIDFIINLSKPNARINEYLIERWQSGSPSRMMGLPAYYISREKLEEILNGIE